MNRAYLNILTDEGTRKVEMGETPITIGRHGDNVIPISDAKASRFHAVIARVEGGYAVRDLESRNGTRLNGRQIKTAVFKPGDVIRIGDTEVRLVVPGGHADPLDATAGQFKPPPPPAKKAAAAKATSHRKDPAPRHGDTETRRHGAQAAAAAGQGAGGGAAGGAVCR